MSGEGAASAHRASKPKSSRFAAGRKAERDDVLAMLRRRRDNAAAVAKQRPSMDDYAEDRRRQLDVIIDEIAQGMHFGDAEVADAIADREAAQ